MSFTSTSRRMPPYVGNGTANEFAVDFPFRANADLLVVVADEDGVATELELDVDFEVDGALDPEGGEVTLIDDGQEWLDGDGDLATGWTLHILGDTPQTQTLAIRNLGKYFLSDLEKSIDKAHMILQEIQEQVDRSLKLPVQIPADDFDPRLPAPPEASRMLMINAAGTGLALGPTPEELSEAAANLAATEAARDAALAAQAAAELAETNAETAETNAEAAATAADASADAAALSEIAAEAAETAAEAAAASLTAITTGGTTGQVLTKDSNADGDYSWQDSAGGGGSSGTPIQESLAGTFGGVNTTYTLSQTPLEPAAVLGFLETTFQVYGVHYTIAGTTVTIAGVDTSAENFNCAYRY
jgi:hypothetical protein